MTHFSCLYNGSPNANPTGCPKDGQEYINPTQSCHLRVTGTRRCLPCPMTANLEGPTQGAGAIVYTNAHSKACCLSCRTGTSCGYYVCRFCLLVASAPVSPATRLLSGRVWRDRAWHGKMAAFFGLQGTCSLPRGHRGPEESALVVEADAHHWVCHLRQVAPPLPLPCKLRSHGQ